MKFNETFVKLKCLQFCHVGINICIFAGRDIKKDNFLCENLLKYIFFSCTTYSKENLKLKMENSKPGKMQKILNIPFTLELEFSLRFVLEFCSRKHMSTWYKNIFAGCKQMAYCLNWWAYISQIACRYRTTLFHSPVQTRLRHLLLDHGAGILTPARLAVYIKSGSLSSNSSQCYLDYRADFFFVFRCSDSRFSFKLKNEDTSSAHGTLGYSHVPYCTIMNYWIAVFYRRYTFQEYYWCIQPAAADRQ